MTLEGSLTTVALPDLLSLLASTAKTGELEVVGHDVDGHLWFDRGQLVGSSVGHSRSHTEALFNLLRIVEGTFRFEPGRTLAMSDEPAQIGPLLNNAEKQVSEWRRTEESVQSMDAVVRLVADAPTPKVLLRAEQWRLLTAAAGGRTVRQVLDLLGASDHDGCAAIQELVAEGLVTVERPTGAGGDKVVRIARSRATAAIEPAVMAPPRAIEPAIAVRPVAPRPSEPVTAINAAAVSGVDVAPEWSASASEQDPASGGDDGGFELRPAGSAGLQPSEASVPLVVPDHDSDLTAHAAEPADTSSGGYINLAPAAPEAAIDDAAINSGDDHDEEHPAKAAKPIERGALLKFLASVRS